MRVLVIFAVLSFVLLAVFGLTAYREVAPEWQNYQVEYYDGMYKSLEAKYKSATDKAEKEKLGMQLETIKGAKVEVKQMLLRNKEVDRCTTCHIDLDTLAKKHPTSKDFPFDVYGCTVCHSGDGRALSKEDAHRGMYATKGEMWWRLRDSDTIFNFWKELAALSPTQELGRQKEKEMLDFRHYTITGEKGAYQGSGECLKCHQELVSRHVDRWSKTKFRTLEFVKSAPDFVAGDEKYRKECYKCHTTGYDEEKGTYAEGGVTCEACHGPGEVYFYLMRIGQQNEGAKIAKVSTDYNTCYDCHTARNHEMRFEVFKQKGYEGDWLYPGYATLKEEK